MDTSDHQIFHLNVEQDHCKIHASGLPGIFIIYHSYHIIRLLTFNRRELRSSRYQLHDPLIKSEFGKTALLIVHQLLGMKFTNHSNLPLSFHLLSLSHISTKQFKLSAPVFDFWLCFMSLLITFVCPMLIVCCYLGQCSLVKILNLCLQYTCWTLCVNAHTNILKVSFKCKNALCLLFCK